jgi:serine/threonine-protein kinase
MVRGDAPRFTDDTAALLRHRLYVIGLVLCTAKGVAVLFTLSTPWLSLRLLSVVAAAAVCLLLRSRIPLSLAALRLCEAALILCFAVPATVTSNTLFLEQARADEVAQFVVEREFYAGAWALFIVCYGVIIPNTWRRALMILAPVAVWPYLNVYLLGRFEPAIAAIGFPAPAPITLLALPAAIYGASALQSIRRAAFEAQKLGQYRLLEKLGSGGMGEVYQAEHGLLKRPCAIKLIRADAGAGDPEAIERFEREVQSTAALSHPNTVQIYDYGHTAEGTFYYVMELLPGMSLEQMVARHGPLPPERAVHFLTQVCDALSEAHALGLIHRDVKPGNVFAARRGGVDDVAKLLDFGLVVAARDGTAGAERSVCGTPAYLSPEQANCLPLDARTDVYSLGAAAYYLVTGQTPYQGESAVDHIAGHAALPLTPPSQRYSSVPADLEKVILRCMAKLPEDRYPSAAAVKEALRHCRCAGVWNSERAAAWWKQPTGGWAQKPPGQLDATLV